MADRTGPRKRGSDPARPDLSVVRWASNALADIPDGRLLASQAIAAIRAELADAPNDAALEMPINPYAEQDCFSVFSRDRVVQLCHAHRALLALIEAAEAAGLEDEDLMLCPEPRGRQH